MPGSGPIEIEIGAGQSEYIPLPAVYLNAPSLPMLTRWRLTDEERTAIAAGADIVFTQLTFGMPFQPIHLQVTMPDETPVLIEQ
jgi:hypothetical protein